MNINIYIMNINIFNKSRNNEKAYTIISYFILHLNILKYKSNYLYINVD